jgi:MraZ protein
MSLGFLGEYQHSLDAKGRVILPVEFREDLAEGAVLTKVHDGCLAVYDEGEFELLAQRVRESARRGQRQRQAARAWFASARHFVPDKQGRFAIPQPLREFARLERDVMVLGVDNRVELWNPVRWREVEADAQADIQSGGSDLDDIGFI